MAAECTEEAILDFVKENGGKVKNTDLIEHFKVVFPEDPEKRTAVRMKFKSYVDRIAYVKTESGVKYVCLRKQFRGSEKENGTERDLNQERLIKPYNPDRAGGRDAAAGGEADSHSGEMGNRGSLRREQRESKKERVGKAPPRIPEVAVPEASALPAAEGPVRSGVFRSSARMSSRNDSDTASVVSSNPDDDRAPATLDPLEHEWMLCASDGEWANLYQLLATEPSLVLRKDFVTGFTCLHWAAKQGKPELIALIINFAKQHSVPASVDVRSSSGYTPLHVAAMHGHMEVVKLLVGAYSADVDARDYSGRKPCHYLTDNVSMDIRDIVGAYERSDAEDEGPRDAGRRWSVSRVLQSHLKPLEKPLRRKSSLYRMKPKLQKLRSRTSQIVHSTSFRGTEELDGSAKASFKSRPKTHFFG
uniref:Sosondowah ankyrin repeat domain family Cb n=1 Tax=Sander lucioperca TaxID=283035 RepID=A0A8C9YDE6_SANLU